MQCLDAGDDVVTTYREHSHALARGVSAESVMAEMFGKQEGCSRGRGGSMHLFCADHRFFGGHAIVAGGLPIAVGLGLAHKMAGEPQVAACFFGEGAAAEGEFHESLNLASLWRLPVVFVCENNFYAMGTALERSQAEPDIAKKAAVHRVRAEIVDGMDVLAVEAAARRAVAHTRAGEGPYFLECRTYRFRAHSMFDPELYRKKQEVEQWKTRGPIVTFTRKLTERGLLGPGDVEAIEAKVAAEIAQAVAFADAGTWEPVEDLARDVYTEVGR